MSRDADVMAAKLQGKDADYRIVKLEGFEMWRVQRWTPYLWGFLGARIGRWKWVVENRGDFLSDPEQHSSYYSAEARVAEMVNRDTLLRNKRQKKWSVV